MLLKYYKEQNKLITDLLYFYVLFFHSGDFLRTVFHTLRIQSVQRANVFLVRLLLALQLGDGMPHK